MRWCTLQTNQYDLQAETYPTTSTYHELHNNNEYKFPVFRNVNAISDRIWRNKISGTQPRKKYDNNWKGGYFRFDDDSNMSYRYILSVTYTEMGQLSTYNPIYSNGLTEIMAMIKHFIWDAITHPRLTLDRVPPLYMPGRPACRGKELLWRFNTLRPRKKMAAISQTTVLIAFSWMKMLEFRLNFHWSLFLRVQLTISSIGSDNGLAPSRRQAIIWTSDG